LQQGVASSQDAPVMAQPLPVEPLELVLLSPLDVPVLLEAELVVEVCEAPLWPVVATGLPGRAEPQPQASRDNTRSARDKVPRLSVLAVLSG
jgi:hypothetical protein